MPSVENLVRENRILRNRFKAALDARTSPIDGILWPLVYLGVKILRHEEAVEGHRSQEDHCKVCLIMGKNYMVAAFSFLDAILNLGVDTHGQARGTL